MKFVYSHTEPGLKKSAVTVSHKGKKFVGLAWCHPDDAWSELTGCRIAETRAQISALKYEHKLKKEKCEECRKFVVAVQQYKNFNPEDPSAKAMFRQLNRRIKEVNKLAAEITMIELQLKASISAKDKILKKLNDKKG